MRAAAALALLAAGFCATGRAAVGVRLLLGVTDQSEARWDGSVEVERGRVSAIDPWRFEGADQITGHAWRATTHRIRLFGGGQQPLRPFVANGVIVWLAGEDESTELKVKTAQGSFSVRLADIPYGKMRYALDGRVMADRIPPSQQITSTPEEEDYPAAAADKEGNVWVAYIQFRHNKDHDRLRANFRERPASFADMKAPAGGDQVFARKYSRGTWGEPLAITDPGGDLYRPAVAVDGSGRAWVFWSANQGRNFDLWARPVENGKPGAAVRLTNAAGSDIDPAAATDAKGNVWVAWQGWRDGKASIFYAVQTGNRFSSPAVVSSSGGNEWNPAITADGSGKVTVAWDSYRRGNYDVYIRTATGPQAWGSPMPAAATSRYEAYPSIAYDRAGRLWVAYEEGAARWGKDFGAYETSGVAVYQGRAIRLVGFEPDGRRVETREDLGGKLPGVPAQRVDSPARQADLTDWLRPHPEEAADREPSRPVPNMRAPKNSLPRLAADASGRLWLACRSAQPVWWTPVGTVWSEYVASYDGSRWTGPLFLAHSDNLLDNRPALVAPRAGELLVIGSSDSRRQFHLIETSRPAMGEQGRTPDPYQNDLYATTVTLPPAGGGAGPKAAPAAVRTGPDPQDAAEARAIAAMRSLRVRTRDGNLRIVRGEFHRHSEISMDGGSDGSILDQWRYILDAASLDWVGCCDHDNGGGREYTWWIMQKLTDIFYAPGKFSPMFSYERSVPYPEGHRNVIFAQRGIRPLPRLPRVDAESKGHAPDTLMLYDYLKEFDGIAASHTSGTNMGTDWRDNDPRVEPVVEIYQGDRQNYEMPGAPRSNSEGDSIGGWRPLGFVNLALEMGYKLGFQASSDHVSTHMSYCNIFVTDVTREAVLEGLKKRHVYGATDNILADVRSGDFLMGDTFATAALPELRVKLRGTAPFAKVHVIKDGKYVYSTEPGKAEVEFTWRDNAGEAGKTSYYYVRGEQEDGEIVWVSPMWITYKGR